MKGKVCPAPRRTHRAAQVLAVVAGTAVLLLTAGPASAHVRLRGSVPAALTTVTTTPSQVRLLFTEVVEPGQGQVLLTGPSGQPLGELRTSRDPQDATTLVTTLPRPLERGTYTVSWRVLSVDGHPVAASFRFAVGRSSSPLTVTRSSGFGPTPLGGLGRALDDVGLLVLVGLVAFPLLLTGRARRRIAVCAEVQETVRRRLRPLLLAAMLLALVGNSLLAVDTLAQASGFPAQQIGGHLAGLQDLLARTRPGRLLAVREAGLLLGAGLLLLLARRRPVAPRRLTRGVAVAAAAALLGTVSLASHAATAAADSPLSIAVDWSHLLAAGVWTGGLLALALAGLPAVRSLARRDPDLAVDQAAALTTAFSDAAQVCMLLVLVTGSYEALVHVSGVGELSGTAWGGELTAKLALWATVLLVATASTASLVPRISRRVAGASARLAACGELASAVRFELATATALITVAAVLAGTAPPDQLS